MEFRRTPISSLLFGEAAGVFALFQADRLSLFDERSVRSLPDRKAIHADESSTGHSGAYRIRAEQSGIHASSSVQKQPRTVRGIWCRCFPSSNYQSIAVKPSSSSRAVGGIAGTGGA